MTHRPGHCWAWPLTDPIARLRRDKETMRRGKPAGLHPNSRTTGVILRPVPVVASKHDKGVAGADGSAHCTSQHLIGCAHGAGALHVHVGFVLLQEGEAEVTEVVDRVV